MSFMKDGSIMIWMILVEAALNCGALRILRAFMVHPRNLLILNQIKSKGLIICISSRNIITWPKIDKMPFWQIELQQITIADQYSYFSNCDSRRN